MALNLAPVSDVILLASVTFVTSPIASAFLAFAGLGIAYSKALNKRAKYLNKWSKTCSKMRLFLMTFPPYIAHFSMHQKGVIFWPLI